MKPGRHFHSLHIHWTVSGNCDISFQVTKKGMCKTIIVFALIIVSTTYYFQDRYLYLFGESQFSYPRLLPFSAKPENRPDLEGGFVIWDEHGMSLTGKGVKYWQIDSITVEKVLDYGYNKKYLVAKTVDTRGEQVFFEFTKNINPDYSFDISVRQIGESDISLYNDFNWIDISKNVRNFIVTNFCLAIVFISLITILLSLFIKKATYR